ncbi:MAG TPA: IS4 family transposase [Thermodesulfovibrionales bacterium]|nr:IS4 family transposase [Thermodesulfovibrionales bacterium]
MSVFCSIFSQLLQWFPRKEFQLVAKKHQAERHAKGFSSWGQFVSMLFCQLGKAQSLREIVNGLMSCEGKLKHLGIEAPKRTTLAYANAHRPWEMYQDLFLALLGRCKGAVTGKKKFRFKNKLMSLDSSPIDLCLSLYDWAKFRRRKGAVKLHLVLDHDGYLPSFAVITEGKISDVRVAHTIQFDPGTIVVDDRGYNDYVLFGKWTAQGIYFVTRMKDNAVYDVVETREVPQNRHILKDEIIRLTGVKAEEKCPYLLRRVDVYDPEADRVFAFLTNHLQLGASTVSAVYKDRWQVELFFKALKQNLKIKTFVGTSANAVKIQIWTALIAMLILKYLQLKSQYNWSLSNLVSPVRMNLFTHRNLWAWLDSPFETLPVTYDPDQMRFFFA